MMALQETEQTLKIFTWESNESNIDDTITVTLEGMSERRHRAKETATMVFHGAPYEIMQNLARDLFVLDVEVSDAELVHTLYQWAWRVFDKLPLWRRVFLDSDKWVKNHVDFVIQPNSSNIQRDPYRQLVIGQELFVFYVVDGERFVDFRGGYSGGMFPFSVRLGLMPTITKITTA